MRDHLEATGTIDFVPHRQELKIKQPDGTSKEVELHDGSKLVLQKNKNDYDLTSKREAMNNIESVREQEKILTGLIYANKDLPDTHQKINTVSKPLNSLNKDELCPGSGILDALNAGFR